MSESFPNGSLLSAIKKLNQSIEIKLKSVEIQDGIVHIFFVSLPSTNELDLFWREISNFISMHFQRKLESEFERYNIYVIYIVDGDVSKELRNKIENDKFSSRKIVEDAFSHSLSEKHLNFLTTTHILNDDLDKLVSEETEVLASEESYTAKNLDIWKLIPERSLKGDTENQKKIVNHIIKFMSNEN